MPWMVKKKITESIVWEANDSSITLQKLRQSNLKCQATNKPTSSAKCHQVFLFFKWLESVMVLCIQCTLEYMFCNVSERRVLLIVQWTTIVYWIIIGKMRDVHLTAFRLAIGKLFHHRDDFAMRFFSLFVFVSIASHAIQLKLIVDTDGAAREISIANCVFLFDGFQLNLQHSHNLLQLWMSFSFTGFIYCVRNLCHPLNI